MIPVVTSSEILICHISENLKQIISNKKKAIWNMHLSTRIIYKLKNLFKTPNNLSVLLLNNLENEYNIYIHVDIFIPKAIV